MTRGKKRFFLALAVVVALLAVAAYLRIRKTQLEASRAARPAPIVESGVPQREHMTRALSFTGDILPIHQANIFSRVTGNIDHMYVDIGTFVHAGQTLALIDTTLYEQTARQLYSQWKQEQAALENVSQTLERTKMLFEKKLVSQQDLENSQMAFKVEQAKADASEAAWHNARTTLLYCRIVAPFSGYITKRFLDPGAYVNNIPTAAGSTLYTLMNSDTLKILVNVLERDIAQVPNVRTAIVHADAIPDSSFTAIVRRTGEAVDLATRTFPVEIDIPNHSHLLKPGMFASTRLVLEEIDSALTVPSDAVLKLDEGTFVYSLTPDSVAHRNLVTLGITTPTRTQITSGLDGTARIVVQGQQLLRDGAKVRIAK